MAIEISPSTPSSPIPTVNGISVIWLGNWDNARVYRRNEGVFYNSSSYRANTSTNQEPSPTATDWDLLSQGIDVSNINNHIANTSNPHSTTAAQVGAIPTSQKGIASGVATLDVVGKIPDVQIASTIARVSQITATQAGAIPTSQRGTANGVASLDANTLIPDAQVSTNIARVSQITATQAGAIPTSQRGTANGVASLDANTLIPDAQVSTNIARVSQITAAQVGNNTAQWNSNQLQGRNIANTTPTSGQVLTYNTTNTRWEPATPSGGGGGGGKLLQTVFSSINTWTLNFTGNWQSIGLSASITPISATSSIYITGALGGVVKSTATNTQYFNVEINDGVTGYTVAVNIGRRGDNYPEPVPINLFIPAVNTSARTYTVRCNLLGSGSITNTLVPSYLTLMEITP
jgi:hypothetical protein